MSRIISGSALPRGLFLSTSASCVDVAKKGRAQTPSAGEYAAIVRRRLAQHLGKLPEEVTDQEMANALRDGDDLMIVECQSCGRKYRNGTMTCSDGCGATLDVPRNVHLVGDGRRVIKVLFNGRDVSCDVIEAIAPEEPFTPGYGRVKFFDRDSGVSYWITGTVQWELGGQDGE